MRKKTIKYTIVDLGGTRYVVLRLADYDYLVQSHQSMAADIIPKLSDKQWGQYRSALCVGQQIHVNRITHCKTAILSKTDYDSLNLAISHLHTLLGNIRLASITVGPSEDEPSAINH